MFHPKPTENWSTDEIKTMYEDCHGAMESLDKSSLLSEEYKYCLQKGREAVTEKMMELIMNTAYFRQQFTSTRYVLYWRDAPQGIAKFVQHLETVFTGNKEIKIRKKASVRNAAATEVRLPSPAAATEVILPSPTSDWKEAEIKTIYEDCQNAMNVLVDHPAIISENYKQCLQRGRNGIVEAIMDLIRNKSYFNVQSLSFHYVLYWEDAPKALASFLTRIESVFTNDEEFKIRRKCVSPAPAMPAT